MAETKETIGFIGVGIFAFTSQAGTGAVLYMVNHGLATGLLFLVVGMLVSRRGSALVTDFGGAGKLLPVLAGVLLFAGLASLALPGTAPFASEFLRAEEGRVQLLQTAQLVGQGMKGGAHVDGLFRCEVQQLFGILSQ